MRHVCVSVFYIKIALGYQGSRKRFVGFIRGQLQ